LAANGALQLVLPTPLTTQVHAHALLNGLSLVRVTDVVTKPGKQPRRSLLHFVKGKSRGPALHTLLTLMDTDGKRSAEYQQLTRDFYL
jgi:tRNA1Val (adenine37-N6)-methyltransferase